MKILVVEDEVQLADTLAEILKRNKYNVDTVFDGDDGLEYARTGIYDCILLDIMLPVRSGTERSCRFSDRKKCDSDHAPDCQVRSGRQDSRAGLRGGRLPHQALFHR
ncbi:MAG: response regulator [Ruminococcus callidus]